MSISLSGTSSPGTDTSNVLDVDPNFKSTLPPRKRAKTKEEKEQRRVERILRNRRAAHASREKKRKHVEYLESYVLKLEENLASLQENLTKVTSLIPDKIDGLNLKPVHDLSDLKEKIHSNLNASVKESNEEDEDEPVYKKRKASVEQVQVKEEEKEQSVFSKKDEDEDLLLVKNESYFNYLSPISINSPINSPIDLTIKKSDDLPPLSLDFSYKGIDVMGQNSEVILSLECLA